MLVHLAQPLFDVSEALSISSVINNEDSMSSLEVGLDDTLKPLLSCCVPYLKLASLGSNLDISNLEVNSNGRHEVIGEDIISIPQKDG